MVVRNPGVLASLVLLLLLLPASAATLHVTADGIRPAGVGDGTAVFNALPIALAQARPGDTVLVHAGTHVVDRPQTLTARGEPGAWITVRAAPGAQPVFDGTPWVPERSRGLGNRGLLHIVDSRFLRLEGLAVAHSHGCGIYVERSSEDIDIVRCRTHLTFGPGIAAWNARRIRVLGCDVSRANDRTLRLPDALHIRENPHEAISIAGVDQFEVAWNHVHTSEKEGIDVKEVSRRGVVRHNHVHGLRRQGLYADAWFGVLEDVVFRHNVVHDCEWGLVIGVEHTGSELRAVRAHDNVLFRNRGSGIYLGTWGGDGPRSGIVIAHNTLHANGNARHWAGPTGGIDLRSRNARDVLVIRNIVSEGGAFQLAATLGPAELAERAVVATGNLLYPFRNDTGVPGREDYGRPEAWRAAGNLEADPRFADPAAGDFRLREDSPARTGPLPALEALREFGRGRSALGASEETFGVPRRVAAVVAGEFTPPEFAPGRAPWSP